MLEKIQEEIPSTTDSTLSSYSQPRAAQLPKFFIYTAVFCKCAVVLLPAC